MWDVGLPELLVILVVAVVVFGPDRLPEFARQAGRFLHQVKVFTQATRDDIRKELGPDFADLDLADLDPRKAVRKHILEAMEEEERAAAARDGAERRQARPLAADEVPPYDSDAT